MQKVRVRIQVEAIEPGSSESRAYPTVFIWFKEYDGTGDNPNFYGGQFQEAIQKASQAAIQNLEPYRVYGGVDTK